VQLRSLALSVVAILALGATPATATPATTPAAWTVTLRDSCLTLCAARTYTVDANGNATYSYGTNAAPTGEQRVVTLDPAVTAAIARAVANAHADAWVQAYIRQPDAYGAFATRQPDGATTLSDSAYMHPDVASSPVRTYTLTMTRPGDNSTVKTAKAEWQLGTPTIEPNDAVDLAATIARAFRPLVR